MKIAICGTDQCKNAKLVSDVVATFKKYVSPAKTIYDELEWESMDFYEKIQPLLEKMSSIERDLYCRMQYIIESNKKYDDKGYIVYNGCSLDVLCATLVLSELSDEVSDDFVEKMIYWNKKLIKNLDVIYWMPNVKLWDNEVSDGVNDLDENGDDIIDMTTTVIKEKEELHYIDLCESCFNNIYNSYINDFEKSFIFDTDNCPAIFSFESENPLVELSNILDGNGNLFSEDQTLNYGRVKELIGDNEVLKKGLEVGLCGNNNIGASLSIDMNLV